MKRIMSLLLSLAIVVTMLPLEALTAFADYEVAESINETQYTAPLESKADISWKRTKEYNWWGTPQSLSFEYAEDLLRWNWNVTYILDNFGEKVWDNGKFANIKSSSNPSFATWENTKNFLGKDLASLRRFRGSFEIPKGFSAKDTVMLSSVNQSSYSGFNDGNIIPINDNIYIFVYKKSDTPNITKYNFMDYLAFWTGTSNQDGIVNFHGVPGTDAYHYKDGNISSSHPLYHVDGWYCNATLDNIGNSLFKNYKDAKAGDEFIIDVFAADYRGYGGMDELEITFKKATDRRAVVKYYKEEVKEENLLGTYVLKNLYEGQEVRLQQGIKEGELNYYKHELGANVYHNGEQRPEVAIVGQEEETVINVVYPLKQDQPYIVEHYLENTDGKTYRIVEEKGTGKLGSTVKATIMEDLPYHTFDKDNKDNVLEGKVDRGKLVLKLYYNRNEYQLSYNANLPEGENLNSGTVPAGASFLAENEVAVAGSGDMHRRGYTFKGWNTKPDGTGESYSKGKTLKILKETELFAQWEKDNTQWFSVKYDANTGTGTVPEDSGSYVIGTTAKVLGKGTLTKEYHTFTGWNTKADGTGTFYKENDITTNLTSNVTLYAQWQENQQYTLSYDADGGIGEVPLEEKLYEGQVHTVKESNIAKAGYQLNGWIYKTDTGATVLKSGANITMPASDVQLKASWVRDESQKHTVSYDNNGGEGNVPQSEDLYHGDNYTVKDSTITKAGYKLNGWASSVDINGKAEFVIGESFIMPNEDVKLTAKWVRDDNQKHTLSYDADGGVGVVPAGKELYYGDNYTVLDSTITKVGYKLDGWKSNVTINGKTDFAVGESFTMLNSNVILKANWVRDEAQKHTVFYNRNEGSGTIPNPVKRYAGDKYTVEDASISRLGYDFIGWEYTVDGITQTLNSRDTLIMPNADVELIAKWQINTSQWHKVNYEANGGSGTAPVDQASYVTGSDVVVKDKASLQLENYKFAGWNTKANGTGTAYQPSEKITSIHKSITLYAQWEKDLEKWKALSYDMQGGTPEIASEEHYVGEQFKLSTTTPTKENYIFDGWKLEGTEKPFASGGAFTMGEKDVTLVAQWAKDPEKWFGVTYDANGATEEAPKDENTYLEKASVTVTSETLTKQGYTFAGWELGEKVLKAGETFPMPKDGAILVAKWNRDETQWFGVTYDANGATEEAPKDENTYLARQTVTVTSETLTKPGYKLAGWELGEEVLKAGETFSMPSGDVTLVAKWDRDDTQWHQVSYNANGANEEAPIDSNEYHVDQEVIVSSKVMSKAGFQFLGWLYNGEHYGSVDGNKDTLIMPNADVELVADFKKMDSMWFKVTYNANLPKDTELVGGSAPVDEAEYMSTDAVTVKDGNGMSVKGYTFKGWMLQPDADEIVAETITVEDHTILYAKWEKAEGEWFTVTYDANGGDDAPVGGEYLVGTKVPVASASEMTRRGFTFGGWTSEQLNGGDVITEESFEMPKEHVTLVAQWDEIVGEVSITHKYFTNNKLDGEVTDESTEVGYEFTIMSLIKDLFNSLTYKVDLSKVVIERRPIVKKAAMIEEIIEVPEEISETLPNGGGAGSGEAEPPKDGEVVVPPTDPSTPDVGDGTEAEPTEPSTPDAGDETEAEPTEPSTPDAGDEAEAEPTDPSTPDDGDETETESSQPDQSDRETATDSSSDTESGSESSSDSDSSGESSESVDTSVLAATSEDDVETVLAKEADIKQAEQQEKSEPKSEESSEEEKAEEVAEEVQEETPQAQEDVVASKPEETEEEKGVEDSDESEDEPTEAKWEEVEAVDGKYIFEEGYEYRITINYYRTVSEGGDSDGGRDHDHHDRHDRDDKNSSTKKPTVTIPDEDVPLAKPGQITIIDEQVPLGKLPQTGGNSAVIAGSSGMLAILLMAIKKFINKKDNQ